MHWHTTLSGRPGKATTPQEQIDTAIHLYENSRNQHEERKSIGVIERAFSALFIFTGKDCNESLREDHINLRDELMKRFQDVIELRKNNRISKYQMAKELRSLCKAAGRAR